MNKSNQIRMFITTLLLAFIIVGCSSKETPTMNDTAIDESAEPTENDENVGGQLNIAVSAQPPTLDTHLTTSTVAIDITKNIFETLMTQNKKYQAVPMLAESVNISEDGKLYTFRLREGVKFHNGKEMISEDIVASMNRWLEKSARAKMLLSGATFEEKDTYTVVLKLQKHASDVLDILAGPDQFPAIMPKEVIESATEEGVAEFIGTGPFKFKEWKQDQYVHLVKYNDYLAVDEEPSGLSGKKVALVDDVYFHIVTDPSTRLAGIQTGDYDIADSMPANNYEQLKDMSNVETHLFFQGTLDMFYNKKEGLMANPKMRQAVNAALDADKIMMASYANEDLYKLDPGYMNPEQVNWASDAGKESYNQGDTEKAKSMLEELGYDGEEIILLATRDYDYSYNAAIVIQEQLEQAGLNVKLEVYDWPTLTEYREDPSYWHMFITGINYVTTPPQLLALNGDYAGWTSDPKITDLMESIRDSKTQEEAKETWDELQSFLWNEYVTSSLFGHRSIIIATTDKLEGFTVFQGIIPWNTRLK